MILIPIVLTYLTWLIILLLFNQHKYLNIFENIALWFWIWISLFVFELFVQGIVFGEISFLPSLISFVVVLGIFMYRWYQDNQYYFNIIKSIKDIFNLIKKSIYDLIKWQRLILFLAIFYAVVKIFMSFSINISHPTMWEDAVVWWDIKTKVFFENSSLILDKTKSEFLWSATFRNVFAPLTDFYFISLYKIFPIWLSNIVSPLVYMNIWLLLFWIFLRKTNILFAWISIYLFYSLPFIFIHSFWAYMNFISWFFLFTFAFYHSDQVFSLSKDFKINKWILIPLGIFSFLDATIRNEAALLMLAVFVFEFIVFVYINRKRLKFKDYRISFLSLSWLFTALISSNFMYNYLLWTWDSNVTARFSWNFISRFLENAKMPWVLEAPFQQMFYHPDYILIYVFITVSLVLFILNFNKMKELWLTFWSYIILFIIFISILYIDARWIWLVTHYSFIRYPIAIIPFWIYICLYMTYLVFYKENILPGIWWKK